MWPLIARALLGVSISLPLLATAVDQPAAFSTSKPGETLPTAWRLLTPPDRKAPDFSLAGDAGTTVLRADAQTAAGTLSHVLRNDLSVQPMLQWRWKVASTVEKADLTQKRGDDFAARVYVFFDVPLESLPFTTRMGINLARLLYGQDLPTAALCYVWDNKHPVGQVTQSAYTDRVRLLVLQSGNTKAGQWQAESRDLAADFKAAFGAEWKGAPPAVTGIAIGNDTDQTGERAVAWFGDLRFQARP